MRSPHLSDFLLVIPIKEIAYTKDQGVLLELAAALIMPR